MAQQRRFDRDLPERYQMTTTEERPRITRPGSGVAIDPRRLMTMRHRKGMPRRAQLSARIAELNMTDDRENEVRAGVDHIGKLETGQRKPSPYLFQALCAALDCVPEDLLPGGPVSVLPKDVRDRNARFDYNESLRRFAIPRGLRYKNPRTGRVYYGKRLREAYALLVTLELAQETGTPEEIRAAEAAFAEALTLVPRAPGADQDARENETELLAS